MADADIVGRKDRRRPFACSGALDEGVPRCDLWISPHHVMFIDGVLIEARDLVNGVSIVQAEATGSSRSSISRSSLRRMT